MKRLNEFEQRRVLDLLNELQLICTGQSLHEQLEGLMGAFPDQMSASARQYVQEMIIQHVQAAMQQQHDQAQETVKDSKFVSGVVDALKARGEFGK